MRVFLILFLFMSFFADAQKDSVVTRQFIYSFHRYTGVSNNYEILMIYNDSTFKLFKGDDEHNEILTDSGKCKVNEDFIVTMGTVKDKKRGTTKTQEYVLSEISLKEFEKALNAKNSTMEQNFNTRMDKKKKIWILKKTDMNSK